MKPEIHFLGISIKTFGVTFALGFVACGAVVARRLKELGRPVDWAYEITFSALVGGVVGARAYYVIQNWSTAKHDLIGSIFSGSGLVWYGGAIGGAIGVIGWMRWREVLELRMLDMCATALALGYAIGRIGCQVSGDGDYGISSNLPWAMGYPHGTLPTPPGVKVQPTPIYETVAMCLRGVGSVAAARPREARRGVRPVPAAQRLRALPGRVHPPQHEVFAGLTTPQLESLGLMAIGLALAGADGAKRRCGLAARLACIAPPSPARASSPRGTR